MTFNSIEFGIFFPLVFILYWLFFSRRNTSRSIFLIVVSYIFYGWWDWRFLSLIFISSLTDFIVGKRLGTEEVQKKRKILLLISLVVNLGFLGFFKYFNFFVDTFTSAYTLLGQAPNVQTLNIILPVGISFYTFQTLSYTLDIYYRKLEPTNDVFAFFAFVSFFPQLVAGPIERARHLLPQFSVPKKLNYDMLRSGFLLIAWGLFKKIVIADRLALFIDAAYLDVGSTTGIAAVLAVIFFAFQLYIDFSAYSEIAIGAARTLGFDLCQNFNHPYLASSFSNFWKRWHISLSSWFKDYLYIPLGGNRHGRWKTYRNIMIVFLLSGLWHGASWNFVFWGGLNGLFILLLDPLLRKIRFSKMHIIPSLLVSLCWAFSLIFFRAETFGDAVTMFGNLGFSDGESLFQYGLGKTEFKFSIYILAFLMIFEIIQERRENLYQWFENIPPVFRWSVYAVLVAAIIMLGSYGTGLNDSNFIYFQF